MSFFYDSQKSGAGVSKEQSEMKPFFKFFDLFGRKFLYLMQLNFIYLLTCIPIITIGASTAALTHVMRKFVLEQPIFVFSEFFSAFRKNFKRTIAVGIFSLIFVAAFGYSMMYYNMEVGQSQTLQNYFMMAMNMLAGAVFLTVNIYVYPQIVCLDLSLSAILKNSVRFCLLGFGRNVVTVLTIAAVMSVMLFTTPFSLIALPLFPFAQLAFLSVFNSYPVIQKYVINPFYESKGEKNPEIPDYTQNPSSENSAENAEAAPIFTDLGGKEAPVDKKKVKITGKLIK
jgi:uncharacterized membrane protein YesL